MDAMLANSIERVEVAKGPQSALYGRNTFGGAVNFVTKRPSNELEGQVEATYGRKNRIDIKGTVSGPIVEDRLFARIAGSYFERDGYFTNELTGDGLDDKKTAAFDGSLEATPSDSLRVTGVFPTKIPMTATTRCNSSRTTLGCTPWPSSPLFKSSKVRFPGPGAALPSRPAFQA